MRTESETSSAKGSGDRSLSRDCACDGIAYAAERHEQMHRAAYDLRAALLDGCDAKQIAIRSQHGGETLLQRLHQLGQPSTSVKRNVTVAVGTRGVASAFSHSHRSSTRRQRRDHEPGPSVDERSEDMLRSHGAIRYRP
jgi:hypothetical protein